MKTVNSSMTRSSQNWMQIDVAKESEREKNKAKDKKTWKKECKGTKIARLREKNVMGIKKRSWKEKLN